MSQKNIIFVPKETREGETRAAVSHETVRFFIEKLGFEVYIEKNAGLTAGVPNEELESLGAKIVENTKEGFEKANIILAVHPRTDVEGIKEGAIWISTLIPQLEQEVIKKFQEKKITCFSLNLLPRITRAQKMDSLSSQANLAGYKAVLMAADALGKIFPLMMTPAGTINPAKVIIMGVGVAGLQAIATAKRLGAHVEATDIRLATKEQVESLGAKFIDVPGMEDLEDEKGYAKEPTKEFLEKQKKEVAHRVAHADVVITTALIPGKKAPKLVSEEMVKSMKEGSVIVDMAAAMGGNCELTTPNETVIKHGVTIIGEVNIPALVPVDATDMYAKNLEHYLNELLNKEGEIQIDMENEVIRECLVTEGGEIKSEIVKEIMN